MSRSGKIEKRPIEPDPIYQSTLVTKFINRLMHDGKKTVAQKVFYGALSGVKEKTGKDPIEVFDTAIKNVEPRMEVKSRRIGGAAYQVPMEVRGDRKKTLAIRWLILAALSRSSKEYHGMAAKLAAEIMDAASGTGAAVKKREDTFRMAEANKAFSHFRW